MDKQGMARPYRFPFVLSDIMRIHPDTGKPTTQKALAEAVGIRPQTISLYVNGETQPNTEVLLKIADFFGVSADFLLTGVSAGNTSIHEYTGLTEGAIEMLNRMHTFDSELGIPVEPLLNSFLSDHLFYEFLEDLIYQATNLKKMRVMSYQELEEKYPGIDMLGYSEWFFTNTIQEFIISNLRERELADSRHG